MKPKPKPKGKVLTSIICDSGVKIAVHCVHAKIEDLAKLVQHPQNPNKHPVEQLTRLAKLFEHQGIRSPAIISKRSGFVIKGNGSIEAARMLGMSGYPVDYQTFKDEAHEYAHLIADNKIAGLAEVDRTMLRELAEHLDTGAFDMDLTGFSEADLEELMTAAPPAVQGENDPAKEWQEAGMAPFKVEPKALRTIHVHFKTGVAVLEFGKLMQQNIGDRTKALWYPKEEQPKKK